MGAFRYAMEIGSRAVGNSALLFDAYIARGAAVDQRAGEAVDFRSRAAEHVAGGVELPSGASSWATDRTVLWQRHEAAARRRDAQLYRHTQMMIPRGATVVLAVRHLREHAAAHITAHGRCATWSIHRDERGDLHAHVLETLRELRPGGFGNAFRDVGKFARQKGGPKGFRRDGDEAEMRRLDWEGRCNAIYVELGSSTRVSRLSNEARGLPSPMRPKLSRTAWNLTRMMHAAGHARFVTDEEIAKSSALIRRREAWEAARVAAEREPAVLALQAELVQLRATLASTQAELPPAPLDPTPRLPVPPTRAIPDRRPSFAGPGALYRTREPARPRRHGEHGDDARQPSTAVPARHGQVMVDVAPVVLLSEPATGKGNAALPHRPGPISATSMAPRTMPAAAPVPGSTPARPSPLPAAEAHPRHPAHVPPPPAQAATITAATPPIQVATAFARATAVIRLDSIKSHDDLRRAERALWANVEAARSVARTGGTPLPSPAAMLGLPDDADVALALASVEARLPGASRKLGYPLVRLGYRPSPAVVAQASPSSVQPRPPLDSRDDLSRAVGLPDSDPTMVSAALAQVEMRVPGAAARLARPLAGLSQPFSPSGARATFASCPPRLPFKPPVVVEPASTWLRLRAEAPTIEPVTGRSSPGTPKRHPGGER